MAGGPENARVKSSSHSPRGAPVVVVHGVQAATASAAQVYSWLGAVEARNLKWSSVHRCIRTVSTGEEGGSHTERHKLLEMVSYTDSAAPLVRGCSELTCTLRGSAPLRRSVSTCAAGANATYPLPDVVVFAGEALRSDTTIE